MTKSAEVLFALIRYALGTQVVDSDAINFNRLSAEDWNSVVDMAFEQGVEAIASDGLYKVYERHPNIELEIDSPNLEDLKYEWFGSSLQSEDEYSNRIKMINSLASFYSRFGIRMMILKGYGLSLNYPCPSHRPVGDIDIYLFGEGEKGDEMLRRHTKCSMQLNPEKHSTFIWEGEYVENHARLIDDIGHPSLADMEHFFEEEAARSIVHTLPVEGGSTIYFPSVLTNALFIPYHLAGHFVHEAASIRQLCDWVCFVLKHNEEIDWDKVEAMSKKAGFFRFFCILNGIVKSCFDMPSKMLPDRPRDLEIEGKVLEEILNPHSSGEKLSLIRKVRRFFSNRWKHNLVYKESIFHSFISRARAYLLLHDKNAESIWEREKRRRQ